MLYVSLLNPRISSDDNQFSQCDNVTFMSTMISDTAMEPNRRTKLYCGSPTEFATCSSDLTWEPLKVREALLVLDEYETITTAAA